MTELVDPFQESINDPFESGQLKDPLRNDPSFLDRINADPSGIVSGAVGLGENILQMVTGIPASIAGLGSAIGKSGIGSAFGGGSDSERFEKSGIDLNQFGPAFAETSEKLTYQPKTESGKALSGAIAYPFEKAIEIGDVAGDAAYDKTGSPLAGAAAKTGISAIPYAVLGAIGRRTIRPESIKHVDLNLPSELSAGEVVTQLRKPSQKALDVLGEKIVDVDDAALAKAQKFLDTDLSQIELPKQGEQPHNFVNYLITSEDAKKAIIATRELSGEKPTKRTWQEVRKAADADELTVNDLLTRTKDSASTDRELYAFKSMLAAGSKNLESLAKKARTGTESEKALFAAQFEEMMTMVDQFHGAKAEAGRALAVLRAPVSDELARIQAIRQIGEKRFAGMSVTELADMVSGVDQAGMLAMINKARKATVPEAMIEAWKAGLLSGLRTHEVNFMSNTMNIVQGALDRTAAAGVGSVRSGIAKLTGSPAPERVYFREAVAQLQGAYSGAIEGSKMFGEVMLKGSSSSKVQDTGKIKAIRGETFGLEGKAGKAVDVAGEVIRLPFRALAASDALFKTTAQRMELHALVTRQALKEGKSGKELSARVNDLLSNPPEKLVKASENYGSYMTFNKELGKTGRSVQAIVSENPPLQIIVPFIKAPTNILKVAGEHTPFALFSKNVRAEIAKGGPAKDIAIAKMMTGSAISSWAAMQALEGNITGGGPSDPDKRRALMASGWRPYSFKIGDTYYPYNRFDPHATLIGITADAVEIAKTANSEDQEKLAKMIAASATKNITNKAFFQGIATLVNVLTDPDRYGERYIDGLAGSTVPTLSAEIAQSMDPIVRETYGVMDAIKSRVPGQSQNLYPKRDVYGLPISRHSGGVEAFVPVQPSTESKDKAYTELVRLKVPLTPPEKKVGANELSPGQYDRYSQDAGELAKRLVDKAVSNPGYEQLPDGLKTDLIKNLFAQSRKIARVRNGIEEMKMQEKADTLRKKVE